MDDFGDRMKLYEGQEAGRRVLPLLPVCARLDGKCFSKYTKGLERPFDIRLTDLMRFCTRKLVEETNACMGYTQSDEISLVWYSSDISSQIFFDGKIQKMVSVLSSMLTGIFNAHVWEYIGKEDLALFDCRVWQLPTLEEAANSFLWREQDATRNSIQMSGRAVYSHKELFGKSCDDIQEMLFQKGINWNDYPNYFKRGTFIQKRKVKRPFSREELDKLPIKHQAHSNPHLIVERTDFKYLEEMPPFSKVINRVGVIFKGEEPKTETLQTGKVLL
jgi:tRNA(His) 5'-end guanylyltransferase